MNRKRTARLSKSSYLIPTALLSLGLLSSSACVAQGDSCDIRSRGISIKAEVFDDDDRIRAQIEFESGDMSGAGTSLELCDTDSVSINGKSASLRETATNHLIYYVDFSEAQEDYKFVFERQEDNESFTATVVPPPGFEIIAPAGEEISREDPVDFSWEPANPDGEMRIDETIDSCVDLKGEVWEDVIDNGMASLEIELEDEDDAENTCTGEFELERSRKGSYPDGLKKGGSVTAYVRRKADFQSTP